MAIQHTMYVRATHAHIRRAARRLPRLGSGGASGAGGLAGTLMVRLGLSALELIKDAFIVKARGGTDASGLRWAPLSPYTIAYSRRHPGVPRKRQRAPFRPSWMLTVPERKRWWSLYARGLGRYKGDRSHAAAVAWFILKQEGARTLMMVYGGTQVEILRDTGLLFNSLCPGAPANSAPRHAPHVNKQVFRLGTGSVTVGTSRRWAGTHHRGIPGRLPQRRLWPEPKRWPSSWWGELLRQMQLGMIQIAVHQIRKGTP